MKLQLINEIYQSAGKNVAELMLEFEESRPIGSRVLLEYKDVGQMSDDRIYVTVHDRISDTDFDLFYNEKTKKLELQGD